MLRSFQRLLESFADFISRGVKDLVDLLTKASGRRSLQRWVWDRRSACRPGHGTPGSRAAHHPGEMHFMWLHRGADRYLPEVSWAGVFPLLLPPRRPKRGNGDGGHPLQGLRSRHLILVIQNATIMPPFGSITLYE